MDAEGEIFLCEKAVEDHNNGGKYFGYESAEGEVFHKKLEQEVVKQDASGYGKAVTDKLRTTADITLGEGDVTP